MPETRKVFLALGARTWVTHDVDNADVQLVVEAADIPSPSTPPAVTRLSAIDFRQCAGVADWAKVQIDSTGVFSDGRRIAGRANYGGIIEPHINVLTVGPDAQAHSKRGGIYVSPEIFYREQPKFDPAGNRWPSRIAANHPYEVMTAAYGTDGTTTVSRRYHGFHAKVLDRLGKLLRLEITTKKKAVELWVNFSRREECDDPVEVAKDPRCSPAVGPDSAVSEGAVFLSLKVCAQVELNDPKQPPGGGDDDVPSASTSQDGHAAKQSFASP